jgi:hypothetical protein
LPETVPRQLRYDGYRYGKATGWCWLQIRAYDPCSGETAACARLVA